MFARLGVRHQARNFGYGGLGTVQNGLGAGSIYGPDVDFLAWDSGMTEKENKALDVFMRQAILGGIKVPVIWSVFPKVATTISAATGADIGCSGSARSGIEKSTSIEKINSMPWAMRYLECSNELKTICRRNEYIGHCWIPRDDIKPPVKQDDKPGGRASWHPGNRHHQLQGRVYAFTILQALKEVLRTWAKADKYVLADKVWHVTEYYQNIKSKTAALGNDVGWCNEYAQDGLGYACNHPVQVSDRVE